MGGGFWTCKQENLKRWVNMKECRDEKCKKDNASRDAWSFGKKVPRYKNQWMIMKDQIIL